MCDEGAVEWIEGADCFSTKDEWTHQEPVINNAHNVFKIENVLWKESKIEGKTNYVTLQWNILQRNTNISAHQWRRSQMSFWDDAIVGAMVPLLYEINQTLRE